MDRSSVRRGCRKRKLNGNGAVFRMLETTKMYSHVTPILQPFRHNVSERFLMLCTTEYHQPIK
jgi:hypothetical protein